MDMEGEEDAPTRRGCGVVILILIAVTTIMLMAHSDAIHGDDAEEPGSTSSSSFSRLARTAPNTASTEQTVAPPPRRRIVIAPSDFLIRDQRPDPPPQWKSLTTLASGGGEEDHHFQHLPLEAHAANFFINATQDRVGLRHGTAEFHRMKLCVSSTDAHNKNNDKAGAGSPLHTSTRYHYWNWTQHKCLQIPGMNSAPLQPFEVSPFELSCKSSSSSSTNRRRLWISPPLSSVVADDDGNINNSSNNSSDNNGAHEWQAATSWLFRQYSPWRSKRERAWNLELKAAGRYIHKDTRNVYWLENICVHPSRGLSGFFASSSSDDDNNNAQGEERVHQRRHDRHEQQQNRPHVGLEPLVPSDATPDAAPWLSFLSSASVKALSKPPELFESSRQAIFFPLLKGEAWRSVASAVRQITLLSGWADKLVVRNQYNNNIAGKRKFLRSPIIIFVVDHSHDGVVEAPAISLFFRLLDLPVAVVLASGTVSAGPDWIARYAAKISKHGGLSKMSSSRLLNKYFPAATMSTTTMMDSASHRSTTTTTLTMPPVSEATLESESLCFYEAFAVTTAASHTRTARHFSFGQFSPFSEKGSTMLRRLLNRYEECLPRVSLSVVSPTPSDEVQPRIMILLDPSAISDFGGSVFDQLATLLRANSDFAEVMFRSPPHLTTTSAMEEQKQQQEQETQEEVGSHASYIADLRRTDILVSVGAVAHDAVAEAILHLRTDHHVMLVEIGSAERPPEQQREWCPDYDASLRCWYDRLLRQLTQQRYRSISSSYWIVEPTNDDNIRETTTTATSSKFFHFGAHAIARILQLAACRWYVAARAGASRVIRIEEAESSSEEVCVADSTSRWVTTTASRAFIKWSRFQHTLADLQLALQQWFGVKFRSAERFHEEISRLDSRLRSAFASTRRQRSSAFADNASRILHCESKAPDLFQTLLDRFYVTGVHVHRRVTSGSNVNSNNRNSRWSYKQRSLPLERVVCIFDGAPNEQEFDKRLNKFVNDDFCLYVVFRPPPGSTTAAASDTPPIAKKKLSRHDEQETRIIKSLAEKKRDEATSIRFRPLMLALSAGCGGGLVLGFSVLWYRKAQKKAAKARKEEQEDEENADVELS